MTISLLQQIPLFKGVDLRDLRVLMSLMKYEDYAEDTLIFREGDPGDAMYIVISGKMQIFVEDEVGNQLTLIWHGSGDVFGELALIDQQPRSASAIAVEPMTVLVLHRVDFLALLNERPPVGMAMMSNLASILRYSTLYLEKIIEWGNRLARGEYDQVIEEVSSSQAEKQIQGLLNAFLQVAQNLKKRHTQTIRLVQSKGD